jgi:hypothetical protein
MKLERRETGDGRLSLEKLALFRNTVVRSWLLALGSWLLILSNCNAGISFHGVVQNILWAFGNFLK